MKLILGIISQLVRDIDASTFKVQIVYRQAAKFPNAHSGFVKHYDRIPVFVVSAVGFHMIQQLPVFMLREWFFGLLLVRHDF